jgi:hypothetical protein
MSYKYPTTRGTQQKDPEASAQKVPGIKQVMVRGYHSDLRLTTVGVIPYPRSLRPFL